MKHSLRFGDRIAVRSWWGVASTIGLVALIGRTYHAQGVAVAVSNKLTPMIIEVTLVNERIMRLRIVTMLGVGIMVQVVAWDPRILSSNPPRLLN